MAAAGTWTDLPQGLVDEISKCLTLYADHIRLRAICVSWRSALPNIPNQLPLQFPLLMFPCDSREETTYEFFSIAENKSYFLDFPWEMSRMKYLATSCRGWLVVDDGSSLGLFNPFTKAHIKLPCVFPSCPRGVKLSKVVLSASPFFSDFVAVASVIPWFLLIWRHGDRYWTCIEEGRKLILDLIFFKQQIITLHPRGEVVIREIIGGHRSSNIQINIMQVLRQPHLDSILFGSFQSLVEYDDDLLVLSEAGWYDDQEVSFVVHKLDWDKHSTGNINAEWTRVESLGDRAYFPYLSPPSYFSSNNFLRCRGNCLYFPVDIKAFFIGGPLDNFEADAFPLFDLTDKRIKPWPVYPRRVIGNTSSIWITPSPF